MDESSNLLGPGHSLTPDAAMNEDQWLGRLKDEQLTDLAVQALAAMRLDEYRADLREKVLAMSSWAIGENPNGHTALWVNKDDVLALIDGGIV